MITKPSDSNLVRWRYLDSLDSIRYSKEDLSIRKSLKNIRLNQAEIETGASILMGNGILVSVNQLIDSFGFLQIASKSIPVMDSYLSKGHNVFFPIRFAFYDYSHEPEGGSHLIDPFLLASYLFKKDGLEGRKYFELSAFPNLNPRRKDWAEQLENHCLFIPENLIEEADDEPDLAEHLITVLSFFNRHREFIKNVPSSTGIREEMVRYFSFFREEQIEKDNYLMKVLNHSNPEEYHNRLMKLKKIAEVFAKLEAKLFNGKSIIDNRSEIRKQFRDNEEEYFENNLDSIDEQKMGVLAVFDSIYNFATFQATEAKQDNQTEPMISDKKWGFDELAFSLGQWARLRYAKIHNQYPNDLSTTLDSYIKPRKEDSDWVAEDFKPFWQNFFDFQCADTWNLSLVKYIEQLTIFEKEKVEFDSLPNEHKTNQRKIKLLDKSKYYELARLNHISIVNKFLDAEKYKIEINEKTDKTELIMFNEAGEVLSRIQIEDFGENPLLSREEKSILQAEATAFEISNKGNTSEYE